MATKQRDRAVRRREAKEVKREAKTGTMMLTLRECIGLLAVLPRQGDLLTGRIIQDLTRNLSPTEKDIKEAGIKNTPTGLLWDAEKMDSIKRVVPIGEKAKEIIAAGIQQANAQARVDFQWLELYGRFVELPPVPEPESNGQQEAK